MTLFVVLEPKTGTFSRYIATKEYIKRTHRGSMDQTYEFTAGEVELARVNPPDEFRSEHFVRGN